MAGIVPRQNSSGGRERVGRISKQGNRYIRRLQVIGATAMLRYARARTAPGADWVNSLLERRPARLVTVAMANKTARIAWALLAKGKPTALLVRWPDERLATDQEQPEEIVQKFA